MDKIPFVDLGAQYTSIKQEIDDAIAAVIKQTAFIKGPFVDRFEEEFGKYVGVKHAVSCGNGTDALEIALQAFGLGKGDEVIVPAQSFIATSESVSSVGAKPIFVDIDPATHNIDITKIERALTPQTKAIIPVHLYGLPADMPAIMKIAEKHKLFVLEDVAQAHSAVSHGHMTGSMGHAATFSFFPGKNLGAYGDGGMIVSQDAKFAEQARKIANHGRIGKYDHEFEGRNSRLDGLQAAILSVKLRHLSAWTAARQKVAQHYQHRLSSLDLKIPVTPSGLTHVYHLFVVEHPRRDELAKELANRGITTGVHYPTALPFLKAYASRGATPQEFPVAHKQMQQVLSLPMYPELTEAQVETVCAAIKDILNSWK